MMAMGLDGSLPSVFADVSPRFYTPIKASIIWGVGALIVAAVFSYRADLYATVLIGGAFASVIVVGVTCLGAALFPYRARDIFESSPAAKYRLGGVPLVTVAGAVGAIATFLLIAAGLTVSALGLTSVQARVVIGGAFATGILFFLGWQMYRRSQGVDTGLAFRYVPPE
jgi:amino acid transporter